jgi:hypothetical protein
VAVSFTRLPEAAVLDWRNPTFPRHSLYFNSLLASENIAVNYARHDRISQRKESQPAGAEGEGLHISYRKTDIKIRDGPFHGTEVVDGLSSQKLGLNPRPAHAKLLLGKVAEVTFFEYSGFSLPVSVN